MQKYREENEQLARRLTELESFTSKNETEKEKMRGKLTESVRLLKELKSQKVMAEEQRTEYERQLHRFQRELAAKEKEVERAKEEAQKKIDELMAAQRVAADRVEESSID